MEGGGVLLWRSPKYMGEGDGEDMTKVYYGVYEIVDKIFRQQQIV